jgi:hypothetical protein
MPARPVNGIDHASGRALADLRCEALPDARDLGLPNDP